MINWFEPYFWGKEKEYVADAIESTWISGGSYVDKFEEQLRDITGSKYALTTSNGTTAIHLALLTLDIGPGDEVIVPGFCFAAVANMVLAVGAKPVFVDVKQDSWCIDASLVEASITDNTKAIAVVHNYGNMCDMSAIGELADRHSLYIIEDAAEALFSEYNGLQAGRYGTIGTFSFQATKTITMGEGGAIVTDDKALYEKAWLIRNHGMPPEKRYYHEIVGHNFRLTNMQAALGVAQIEFRHGIIERKKAIVERYQNFFDGKEGFVCQKIESGCKPLIWAFAVLVDPNIVQAKRDEIMEFMKQKNIETRPGFYSMSDMSIYSQYSSHIPISESLSRSIISLPSSLKLELKDVDYICSVLSEVI